MNVRRATPDDVPALVRLFQELDRMQRDWRVFTPRPGFYDEVASKYRQAIAKPDALILVAENEGEVVGMAYGETRVPSRFSDERALELSGVVVRADSRGMGVGRALVREAGRFAAERDIPWIELKTFAPNQGAMDFWESLGFRPRVVQLTSSSRALNARLSAG
jgi:ribosomal protein S18 acetylase RimI-like enzyme